MQVAWQGAIVDTGLTISVGTVWPVFIILFADIAVLTFAWFVCFEKTRDIATKMLKIPSYKAGLKMLWMATIGLVGLIFLTYTIGSTWTVHAVDPLTGRIVDTASVPGHKSLAAWPWQSADFYMLFLCVAGYFYAFYIAEDEAKDPELGNATKDVPTAMVV